MGLLLEQQASLNKLASAKIIVEDQLDDFATDLKWLASLPHASAEGIERKQKLFDKYKEKAEAILNQEKAHQDKLVHYFVVWAYDLAEVGKLEFSEFLKLINQAIGQNQEPNGTPIKPSFKVWKYYKIADFLKANFDAATKSFIAKVDWLSDLDLEAEEVPAGQLKEIYYYLYFYQKERLEPAEFNLLAEKALEAGAKVTTDYKQYKENLSE